MRVGTYFLLLKMSMLDLSENFSYTAMTLLGVAALLLFRGMEIFFPSTLALCSYSLPFLMRAKCWADDTQQRENVLMDQLFP